MNSNTIRRGPAFALLLAWLVAAFTLTTAQTQKKGPIERFTATAVNVSGAGGAVKIDLLRWSTDAERDQLLSVAAKGDKELLGALEKAPTVGYLWTTESAGYSLRYAYRVPMAGGGERVILATDRRLGSWDARVWRPTGPASATDYPFTVVELRLKGRGPGEGKASLTAKVIADNEAKTLALDNYGTAPVVLKDVKREDRGL